MQNNDVESWQALSSRYPVSTAIEEEMILRMEEALELIDDIPKTV